MFTLKRLVANSGLALVALVMAGCVTCGPGTFEKNVGGDRQCLPMVPASAFECGEGTHVWEKEEGRGVERECAPDIRCGPGTKEKDLHLTGIEYEEGRGVERECVPETGTRN